MENSQGLFHYLPLATRSIRKLTDLIDDSMAAVGAQRVSLPMLTPAALWKASGRWDSMGTELLRTKDNHGRDLVFAPTHEEAVTSLASTCALSYKSLPLRLYQVLQLRFFTTEPAIMTSNLHSKIEQTVGVQ